MDRRGESIPDVSSGPRSQGQEMSQGKCPHCHAEFTSLEQFHRCSIEVRNPKYCQVSGAELLKHDLSLEFRDWAERHNRDNYGRYDAFKAGYDLAKKELTGK